MVSLGKLQTLHEMVGFAEAHIRDIGNGQTAHQDRQNFGLETFALASRAPDFSQVVRKTLFAPFAIRFVELSLNVGNNSLKTAGIFNIATEAVPVANGQFKIVAVQNCITNILRELTPGRIKRKVQFLSEAGEQVREVTIKTFTALSPRRNRAISDAELGIANHHNRIYRHGESKPGTARACAKG